MSDIEHKIVTAVYTHIDGQNHVLHNHIIVNKVNLETGHKLRERPGEAVERARQINDRLAEREHWQVITPVREHQSKTEQDLTKKRAILVHARFTFSN